MLGRLGTSEEVMVLSVEEEKCVEVLVLLKKIIKCERRTKVKKER